MLPTLCEIAGTNAAGGAVGRLEGSASATATAQGHKASAARLTDVAREVVWTWMAVLPLPFWGTCQYILNTLVAVSPERRGRWGPCHRRWRPGRGGAQPQPFVRGVLRIEISSAPFGQEANRQ